VDAVFSVDVIWQLFAFGKHQLTAYVRRTKHTHYFVLPTNANLSLSLALSFSTASYSLPCTHSDLLRMFITETSQGWHKKKKRRRHAADDTSNALTPTVFMLTAERIDVVDTVASRVRRSEPPWSPLNTINLIRCRIGSQCTIYRNQGMTFIHTCTHRNRDREREITSMLYLYHDPLSDSSIALQTLTVWSGIDRTLQWTRARRKSIASTCIVETCQKYGHDIYRENSKQTTAQFTQRNAKCLY